VKAIEALTAAADALAHSASGPDRSTFWLTAGVLMANLVLAIAAVWSAVVAARSAKASKESAQSAKDLVRLEYRKAILADMPKLNTSRGYFGSDRDEVIITNAGPGDALHPKMWVHCNYSRCWPDKALDCEVPLPDAIESQRAEKFYIQVPEAWSLNPPCVMICHYEDIHHSDDEPRIYHSVFVSSAKGEQTQRYFPPERPMGSDSSFRQYLDRCKACNP